MEGRERERLEWRELTHTEKMKYAQGMRRLNLGYWGYPVSTLRAIHLTTREGDDNTTARFARDLRRLISGFRREGYAIEYCGALEYSPGKGLLHWHGLLRVKGGYFVDKDIHRMRRVLGDRWNAVHGAFAVEIKPVRTNLELRAYILKHIMKEYVGEDEAIRNKFLFSKGWMRAGWKACEELARLWVLGGEEADGGLGTIYMNKERWQRVNEIMQAWAEKRTTMFCGDVVDGVSTGYLFMELGRIREAEGSAFVILDGGLTRRSKYVYLDY